MISEEPKIELEETESKKQTQEVSSEKIFFRLPKPLTDSKLVTSDYILISHLKAGAKHRPEITQGSEGDSPEIE